MKTVFVLLFYLYAYHTDGGMTVATAEFNSQQACENAAQKAGHQFKSISTSYSWVCVPKE